MKKKLKNDEGVQLSGHLKFYIQWPIYMAAILVIISIGCLVADIKSGAIMLVMSLVFAIMVGVFYFFSRSIVLKDLMEIATEYGEVQNTVLKELGVPYAILQEDGKIIWMNHRFEAVLQKKHNEDIYIQRYIPALVKEQFPEEENETVQVELVYNGKEYNAELHRISLEKYNTGNHTLNLTDIAKSFIAVYLHDVTELNQYIRETEEQRMVSGLIYIDNYDEVSNSVDEEKQSLFFALVERRINQYITDAKGIIKKLENDKYFIAIPKSVFTKMEEDQFSVLESVKSVKIGNSIPTTISIGLGLSRDTYALSYSYARAAIDLALARGGDQAVIKSNKGITYYGGKQEQTSKNTRVKARVKAEALREILVAKEKIFIMGHKLTDVDALGAAIGIYRAAKEFNKQAHIIVNEVSASLRPLYNSYMNNEEYPKDLLINSADALNMVDENSLVIVVDTNRPKMAECEELLTIAKTIVVIDHHRQSSDNIENAVLSYVEPYASSACEMVAEILQYIVDGIKIPKLEASSLYAGIMIDTNYFVNKTGVRTFEAAAFLRRCGADLAFVRKLFRDDMDAYRAKAAIISNAEVYHEKIAIAAADELNVESPTIIGAQAANELLDINGIKASFVLTVYKDRIYISARSIDEVNVQFLMEKLGGGGHMNAAGAQIDHTDIKEAVKVLKGLIDEAAKKGGI